MQGSHVGPWVPDVAKARPELICNQDFADAELHWNSKLPKTVRCRVVQQTLKGSVRQVSIVTALGHAARAIILLKLYLGFKSTLSFED